MRHRVVLFTLALITWLLVLVGSTSPVSAQEPRPQAGSTIKAALQPFVDRHVLAGAVALVADETRTLSVDAVGFSDVARGTPMDSNTVFWIASQSKPITAAAIMILVDEGKLRLDDPVEKYLPEFHDLWLAVEHDSSRMVLRRPGHPITTREILSHTSGLPFSSPIERPTLDLLPLRVGALSYAATPLVFEPGSRYQYSNAGINTAGRIIEVISGIPYEEFLERRLLRPLGMNETTFWPDGALLSRLAKSYRPDKDGKGLEETLVTQLHYPLSDRSRQPMPAGGLFSTAHDLGNFCRMMLNRGVFEGKRLLSESAWTELTRRQTPSGVKEDYGLGFGRGGTSFGHGGAYTTNMEVDPDRGLIYVYMVQHAGFPGDGGKGFEAFKAAAAHQFGKDRRSTGVH
jgi:CubicO group peptidase (beta-lactamase class C family)